MYFYELSRPALLIYLFLQFELKRERNAQQGFVFLKVGKIAEAIHAHPKTVWKAIAELKAGGFIGAGIEVANIYRFCILNYNNPLSSQFATENGSRSQFATENGSSRQFATENGEVDQ